MYKKKEILISVLIPVYNSESTLGSCLDSIIKQTYKNLEIIIINDGSTDSSIEKINKYKKKDRRIKSFTTKNQGIANALNYGLSLCKGEWICRMDSDDIALPERIRLQYDFAFKNKLDIIGCWFKKFNDYKIFPVTKLPTADQAIKVYLFFNSPFAHPSTLIRKSILDKEKYDNKFKNIEDYELWCRLAKNQNIKFGNCPSPLLLYRISKSQIHYKFKYSLFDIKSKIGQEYAKHYQKKFPKIFVNFYHENLPFSKKELDFICFQNSLIDLNNHSSYLEKNIFAIYKKYLKKLIFTSANIFLVLKSINYLYPILKKEYFLIIFFTIIPIKIRIYILKLISR